MARRFDTSVVAVACHRLSQAVRRGVCEAYGRHHAAVVAALAQSCPAATVAGFSDLARERLNARSGERACSTGATLA